MVRLCDFCDINPGNLKCAGCSKARYCSKECQRGSWNSHKFQCDAKSELTTANYLWKACMGDYLPKHKQTRIDYGFQRAFSGENQSKLLGLYQGLVKFNDVPAKTLHHWRKRGTLAQEIKRIYEAIPAEYRGGYYPWFLKNQWVLDGKTPEQWGEEQAIRDEATKIARAGWIYAGYAPTATDSQIAQSVAAWTKTKKNCWRLCGLLLVDKWHYPEPRDDIWIPFGFCTCEVRESDGAELNLAGIYRDLLYSCDFDELLTAYESSQLYTLFEINGLSTRLGLYHPLVEGILRTSPKINLSVWNLKQFIVSEKVDDNTNVISVPTSVKVDYFGNCKSGDDVKELAAIYKSFFIGARSKSPVELHNACITGDLYKFVANQVEMDAQKKYRYRSLMRNLYPTSPVSASHPRLCKCPIHWADGCTLSDDLSDVHIRNIFSQHPASGALDEADDHILTPHGGNMISVSSFKDDYSSRLDGMFDPFSEDMASDFEDNPSSQTNVKLDGGRSSPQDGASPPPFTSELDDDLLRDGASQTSSVDAPNSVWPTLVSVVIGLELLLRQAFGL